MKVGTVIIYIIKIIIVLSLCFFAWRSPSWLISKKTICFNFNSKTSFESYFKKLLIKQFEHNKNVRIVKFPFCFQNTMFFLTNSIQDMPFKNVPVFFIDTGSENKSLFFNNFQYVAYFGASYKTSSIPFIPVKWSNPQTAAQQIVSFVLNEKYLNFFIVQDSTDGGGLGNQLFKYATALTYAWRFHKKLLWSDEDLEKAFIIDKNNPPYNKNFFLKILREKVKKLNRKVYTHKSSNKLFQKKDISEISGYLQAYKNIADSVPLLRKHLKFKPFTNKKNKMLAQKLQTENSVCIHVRLGDYVGNGYPLLDRSYYYINAVNYMNEHIENPVYYVFSNEPKRAAQLRLSVPFEVVEGNTGSNSFRDMQLMSLCRHNIIANSTFSWWAALLNQNKNKIVVYPDIWLHWDPEYLKALRVPEWIEIKTGITVSSEGELLYPDFNR